MYSLQFLQVSLLGTSQKWIYRKMADLAEFWLILERELVEHATCRIFDIWIKISHNILWPLIYPIHLVSLNLDLL
jgi:hypothetical protein